MPTSHSPTAAPTLLPVGATLPALPPSVPRQGHPRWRRALGRFVLRVLGWRFVGGFSDVPHQVVVGAPHTSNLDGLVGLSAAAVVDIGVHVFAKQQLFWGPLGASLRAFGGVPVDRNAPGGLVEQAAAVLQREAPGIVALTPEGTRSAVPRWKTGFHRIAVAAGVPIAVVAIDWGRKQIGVTGTFLPSGDLDTDLATIGRLLDGVVARHPERATLPEATG